MIDFNQYLSTCRYFHPGFHGIEFGVASNVIHHFSDLFETIEVCTTEVYPQFISLNNNSALVWDYSFWMLYKRFLLGIWRFGPESSDPEELSNFLLSIQYLFLSLRFTKFPSYSCFFAEQYFKLNKLTPNMHRIENSKEEEKLFGTSIIKQLNDLAQCQVFFHELWHYRYKKDRRILNENAKRIKDIFTAYDSVLYNLPTDDIRNKDRFWDNYHYFSTTDNINIIEEISCDVFAIIDFIEASIDDKNSKEDLFKGYISTIRYVMELQRILTHAERRWKIIRNSFDDYANSRTQDEDWYSRLNSEMLHTMDARSGIIFQVAGHLLGINELGNMLLENDLFDSRFYFESLKRSQSRFYDTEFLSSVYVYLNDLLEKFTLSQLRSTRDLLIGWY